MRVLTVILFLSRFALGKSACSLCPDGSNPTLPQNVVLPPSVTCQAVDDGMRQLPDEECNSDGMHQNGIVGASTAYGMNIASYCGCEGVDPPSDPCQVCPTDQILINEEYAKHDRLGNPEEGFTCAWWYEVAKHSPAEDQHWCKDRLIVDQEFSKLCCGVSKSPCSLCPDGSSPTLPEKVLGSARGYKLTCLAADEGIKQLPFAHCTGEILKYYDVTELKAGDGLNMASYCGCEGVDPPSDPCQVCAADQGVINEDTILPSEDGTPEYGAFTCSVWYEIAKHSPAADQNWCKDQLIVDANFTLYTDLCCGAKTPDAPTAAPASTPASTSSAAGKAMFPWMLMVVWVAKYLS